jgi:putative tryptophan/tyrosine transport system substrate-binding protein
LCLTYPLSKKLAPTQTLSSSAKKVFRVAIMTPISHPSLEQIQKGFVQTLNDGTKHGAYEFTTYNANGNRTLMYAQAEEIVNKRYDLIFTLGAGCSCMAKEVTSKKKCEMPVVFAAVHTPERLNLIVSKQCSGNNVTGAQEVIDYKKQLDLLLFFKPTIKNILLVYDPSQDVGFETDKKEIAAILAVKNITLHSVEVFQTNEVYSRAAHAITSADAVLVLKDNTVVSAIDGLVKLCGQQHIPLMVTDLDSVEKGAAFGFGVREIEFGILAAQKAKLILEQHKKPSEIPVTGIEEFKIKCNQHNLAAQGISLAPELLFLVTSSEGVRKDGAPC